MLFRSVAANLPEDILFQDMKSILSQKREVKIFCVNYTSKWDEQIFRFCLQDEHATALCLAEGIGKYLYEPNASILKAGAYKSVALRYEVKKLNVSSHLYTSDNIIAAFPGRVFDVADVIPFSSRTCKVLATDIPQANITVRNFPLSVDELRKRTRIAEGGDIYLFATTLQDGKKVILKCRKILI